MFKTFFAIKYFHKNPLRFYSDFIAKNIVWRDMEDSSKLPPPTKIDPQMIQYLERLSLVKLGNAEGVRRLEAAIHFADKLSLVDTENIEPMYTVLENECLYLREDKITEGNIKDELLQLAALHEDDYYIAPPGNIPMKSTEENYVYINS